MGMAFLGLVGNVIGVVLAFVTVKVIKDYAEVEMVLFELKEDDLFIVDGNLMSEGQRVFMDDRNLEEGNLEEGNIFGKEN